MKKIIIVWGGLILIIILILFILFICMRVVRFSQIAISTEYGVNESEMVTLGGISQYIYTRGEDIDNPVVLFLHGGPGNPISYVAAYMQQGLEDDYTFVHWDQRGCGRSYYANPNAELSVDLLLQDMDELVNLLCDRYQQDKVIIMGHSWGTVLGTRYCLQHPEKVEYYIGIGQVVDINEGEALAAQTAMERAREEGNEEDSELIGQHLATFQNRGCYENLDWDSFTEMRGITGKYLSPEDGMSFINMAKIALLDPEMDIKAVRWFLTTNDNEKFSSLEKEVQEYLFDEFRLKDFGYNYEVPMYFISGDSDWGTPYILVQEFYEKVNAPKKGMYIIKGAGHSTYMDNQQGFYEAMVKIMEDNVCLE